MKPEPNLIQDVDMSRHTAWRAGGRAKFGFAPASEEDLANFLRDNPCADYPIFFVGLGSNLLIRDGGISALLIFTHSGLSDLKIAESESGAEFYASAGVAIPKLARHSAKMGFEGGEFFAGIPGTVGGALAMNAGCYGSETWEHVTRVKTISRHGNIRERVPDEYCIGYRSVKPKFPEDEFFLGGWFRFENGDGKKAQSKIKNLLVRRVQEQPLNKPNSGSVFRNPQGDYAARLIERCGLKDKQVGAARVSKKHANFIINTGNASANDIEVLIRDIQLEVRSKYGVQLKREVRIIGEEY